MVYQKPEWRTVAVQFVKVGRTMDVTMYIFKERVYQKKFFDVILGEILALVVAIKQGQLNMILYIIIR